MLQGYTGRTAGSLWSVVKLRPNEPTGRGVRPRGGQIGAVRVAASRVERGVVDVAAGRFGEGYRVARPNSIPVRPQGEAEASRCDPDEQRHSQHSRAGAWMRIQT